MPALNYELLNQMTSLCRTDASKKDALDLLYDALEIPPITGNLNVFDFVKDIDDSVDAFLAQNFDLAILIGFLTFTLRYKTMMYNRHKVYQKALSLSVALHDGDTEKASLQLIGLLYVGEITTQVM